MQPAIPCPGCGDPLLPLEPARGILPAVKLDEYLSGPEAMRDLEAALVAGPLPAPCRPAWDGVPVREGRSFWYIAASEAWTGVALCGTHRDDGEGACYPIRGQVAVAYYRPEGERYIVSDCGEAVRALRLRTALVPHEAAEAADRVMMNMRRHAPRWWLPNTCVGSAIEIPQGVPLNELPAALCLVLLAAHRVARNSEPEA